MSIDWFGDREKPSYTEIIAIRDKIERAWPYNAVSHDETTSELLFEFDMLTEDYRGPERGSLRMDAHVYFLRSLIFTEGTYWGTVYGMGLEPIETGLPKPDERQRIGLAAVRVVALQGVDDQTVFQEVNLDAVQLLARPSVYLTAFENEQVAIAREQFLIRFVKTSVEISEEQRRRVAEIFGRERVETLLEEYAAFKAETAAPPTVRVNEP